MNLIGCPRCGFVQDQSQECQHCGIVFAKYRERAQAMAPAPRPVVRSPRPAERSEPRRSIGVIERPEISQWSWKQQIVEEQGPRQGDELFNLLVRALLAYGALTFLFYLTRWGWLLYGETLKDTFYQPEFEEGSLAAQVLALSPFWLAFKVTIIALLSCLFIGMISQMTTITKGFQQVFGPNQSVYFFGALCTAFTSCHILIWLDIKFDLIIACGISCLPVLMLFQGAIRLTAETFPELQVFSKRFADG